MAIAIIAYQKQCRRCGEVKNLSEFYSDKKMPDGHFSSCKKCNKEMRAIYRKENIEKVLIMESESRKRNQQKRIEYSRNYHEKISNQF